MEVEDLAHNYNVFLRALDRRDGGWVDLKGVTVNELGRRNIENRVADAAFSIFNLRRKIILIDRNGTRKDLLFLLHGSSMLHGGALLLHSLIFNGGLCRVLLEILSLRIKRILICQDFILLHLMDTNGKLDTVFFLQNIFHQLGGFCVIDQIHAALEKRDLNIQLCRRKTVSTMIEKSVCNNSSPIGLHEEIGNTPLVEQRRVIARADTDPVQFVDLTDGFLNAIKGQLGNDIGKFRGQLHDALLLIGSQLNGVRPCRQENRF